MSDRNHRPDRGGYHHRGNRHNYNSNSYGSRRNSRPYQGGRDRHRGPPPHGNQAPGNRFAARTRENPEDAVWRNLLNMLMAVGEQNRENRVSNLKLLVDVITGSNAELFLAYDATNVTSAKHHFGPMVIHLLNCITALPQHTATYATLAHLIHARTKSITPAPQGSAPQVSFAQRCMGYSVRFFGRDLDTALSPILATDRLHAERRCHFMVRFWAMWWTNIPGNRIVLDDASSRIVPFAIQKAPLENFAQFLQTLVTAAQLSRKHHKLFASLALTGANALETSAETEEWKQRYVCQPIEELFTNFASETESGEISNGGSDYAPGVGKHAILLLYEQWESEEALDDDDDEEDSRNSSACCDSLQDLLRISKLPHDTNAASFQLLQDAPWKEFEKDDLDISDDSDSTIKLLLDLFEHSEMLLSILRNREPTSSDSASSRVAECPSIVPRLPIFGPPSSKDGQDEDEEEDEVGNPRLKAYKDSFTLLDRHHFGQMIRDIVISHEPSVTDAGLERGNAKTAAEHVWRLHQQPMEGMEYCILEAIMPMMMTSCFSVPYIGKVILELTKIEPAHFAAAIALAIHTIVEDYMPNLTPRSRSVFASWFAFHLIQTDYQWPIAYWQHWEHDDDIWNSASRKLFIRETLSRIAVNVCSPRIVIQECLPQGSKWGREIIQSTKGDTNDDSLGIESLASELTPRFTASEGSAAILAVLTERSDLNAGNKVKAIIRSLLHPAIEEHKRQLGAVDETQSMSDESDPESVADALPLVAKLFERYCHVLIQGVVGNDEAGKEGVGPAIIQEVGEISHWSSALLKTCIKILLDIKLVTPETVVEWQIQHFEDHGVCWWDTVNFVVQYGLQQSPPDSAPDDAPAQAVGEDPSMANTFLSGIMPLIVSRVTEMIVASDSQAMGHRLPHRQVLLVEGLKVVVRQAEMMYSELYPRNNWDQSVFSGPGLAQTIEVAGLPAIDLLRTSLKCM